MIRMLDAVWIEIERDQAPVRLRLLSVKLEPQNKSEMKTTEHMYRITNSSLPSGQLQSYIAL